MKKSRYRPLVMLALLVIATLFYYFGELVDWAAWESLRLSFFYGIHDVHRLLFLAPIVYAGYYARIRGAVIMTLVSFLVFLPRAFFISPYPDPLLRVVLFTVVAGAIGILVGALRNQVVRVKNLENTMAIQRDRMFRIVNNMADGVMITGPDHVIRFMNSHMIKEFGDGVGRTCYQHLRGKDTPCQEDCLFTAVMKDRKVYRWICRLSDDKAREVIAAPYVDSEGEIGLIAILREVSPQ